MRLGEVPLLTPHIRPPKTEPRPEPQPLPQNQNQNGKREMEFQIINLFMKECRRGHKGPLALPFSGFAANLFGNKGKKFYFLWPNYKYICMYIRLDGYLAHVYEFDFHLLNTGGELKNDKVSGSDALEIPSGSRGLRVTIFVLH